MQIRPDIALQAVLKSLHDVVLPAVDADNKLAQEQAQLVVGLLTLVAQRLPLQFRYDVDELTRLLALARTLGLDSAAQDDVLRRAGAGPDEVVAAVGALRAAIGDHIDTLGQGDAAARAAVLAAAREQHLRERSWLSMQGWEVDPATVPAIETLIGPAR